MTPTIYIYSKKQQYKSNFDYCLLLVSLTQKFEEQLLMKTYKTNLWSSHLVNVRKHFCNHDSELIPSQSPNKGHKRAFFCHHPCHDQELSDISTYSYSPSSSCCGKNYHHLKTMNHHSSSHFVSMGKNQYHKYKVQESNI